MSEQEFATLLASISGPRSFSLSSDQIEDLQTKLPSQAAQLTFVLAALSYVSAHVSRMVDSGVLYKEAISSLVEELDKDANWGPQKQQIIGRFSSLLHSELHKRYRKLKRLQSGFVPNAVAFSTLVDLRPDFGDGPELSLKGFVTILQMRVTTDASDPNDKRIVFQLSETALGEMKKAIDRAESKLALIKKDPTINLQIIEN
jgi:hypothetical protein